MIKAILHAPWKDPKYQDNSDGKWDFIPPIHRPNKPDDWNGLPWDHKDSNWKMFHEDYKWPFKKIPRTFTSFIFLGTENLAGNQTNKFQWKGLWHRKPWPNKGEWQLTKVMFQDPITREEFSAIYYADARFPTAFRFGPRISDDLENGPGYCYVNYWNIPFGSILTVGTKKV